MNISALKVNQWLPSWDEVKFDEDENRKKPSPFFYLFSINANTLRRLAIVNRRKATGKRRLDSGIQRMHDADRSDEISEFITGGFPWSVLSSSKRSSDKYSDLRMPGWLPTAIIANIKAPGTIRNGIELSADDALSIDDNGTIVTITLPDNLSDKEYRPTSRPIEIIDGQHRLLAFAESFSEELNFEIPVVAFYDLDISWQAYLFYVINIKPKKINTSLAYDLYPVLRVQEWLERSPEGLIIYRETRAQELVETLWLNDESPWKGRINMLGNDKKAPISQASFIRTLIASFIKKWEAGGSKIGGLFGASIDSLSDEVLYWSRTQQSAFVIKVWQECSSVFESSQEAWAINLREIEDSILFNKYSMITNDQGVRGILQIVNDLMYVGAEKLELNKWEYSYASDEINMDEVSLAIQSLNETKIEAFLNTIFSKLQEFDWRLSKTPGLPEDIRKQQMIFKGSSGYKELRKQLLEILSNSEDEMVSSLSQEVQVRLGYVEE
jgi:DGQHR domain-containing protein